MVSSLEDILASGGENPAGLINGDRLVASVRGDDQGSFGDKVFSFTEHGDILYHDVDEPGELYHAVTDKEGRLSKDERFRVDVANAERASFRPGDGYDVGSFLADLDSLSRRVRGRSFLPDSTRWFREQLGHLSADAAMVSEEELSEALKGYRASTASMGPFGRDGVERRVVRLLDRQFLSKAHEYLSLKEDPGRRVEDEFRGSPFEHLVLTADAYSGYLGSLRGVKSHTEKEAGRYEAFLARGLAARLDGNVVKPDNDDLTELVLSKLLYGMDKASLGRAAEELLESYVPGVVGKASGKHAKESLRSHGLSLERPDGMPSGWKHYHPTVKRGHASLTLSTDGEEPASVHARVELGEEAPFVRDDWLLKERRRPFAGLSGAYRSVRDSVSKGLGSLGSGVVRKALPYVVSGALLFGGGWLVNRHADDVVGWLEDKVEESSPVERPAGERDYVVGEEGSEAAPPERVVSEEASSSYVVEPGDCLWDIAESYTGGGLADVVDATNALAEENGMLSVAAYEDSVAAGASVSAADNPHLIFPGQELSLPVGSYGASAGTADSVGVSAYEEPSGDEGGEGDSDGGSSGLGGIAGLVAGVAAASAAACRKKRGSSLDDRVRYALPPAAETKALPAHVEPSSAPSSYVDVVEDAVRLRNRGASFRDIRERYDGFRSDDDVVSALRDYQGLVQSGVAGDESLHRYDSRVASDGFKARMVHE
ncbi:LysM peptidoglycan-binding domain-containing protein, partial [Candidatus Woesearchaeota archaeon]|nr:LysM peptidoglycan-binding domain-containing protein [Candidatus Woesearchaeota archaeon]